MPRLLACIPAHAPILPRFTDNPEFKRRIMGALGLLVASKVLNVQVMAGRQGREACCGRPLAVTQGVELSLTLARHESQRHGLAAPTQVPFFFKHAVDALNIDPTGATWCRKVSPLAYLILNNTRAEGGRNPCSDLMWDGIRRTRGFPTSPVWGLW